MAPEEIELDQSKRTQELISLTQNLAHPSFIRIIRNEGAAAWTELKFRGKIVLDAPFRSGEVAQILGKPETRQGEVVIPIKYHNTRALLLPIKGYVWEACPEGAVTTRWDILRHKDDVPLGRKQA
jgi:hypothetical protein